MAQLFGDRYAWRDEENTRPFAEWQLTYRLHRAGLPVPAPIARALPPRGLDLPGDIITERLADGRLARGVPAHRRALHRHLDLDRPLHPPLSRPRRLSRGPERAQRAAERGERLPDRLRPLPAAQARACGATGTWCACVARSRRSPGRCRAERFSESDWHGLLDGYRQSSGKSRAAAVVHGQPLALPLSSRRLPRRAAHLPGAVCGADCSTAATGTTSASASASARRQLPRGVWVHAVSVGEVQACAPLVSALCAPPSRAAAHRHDLHAHGRGAGARALRQRRAGALRALRSARCGAALLRARAAASRGHLRDRAVAEPLSRVRPAAHTAGAGERAHLDALASSRYRRLGRLFRDTLAAGRRRRRAG